MRGKVSTTGRSRRHRASPPKSRTRRFDVGPVTPNPVVFIRALQTAKRWPSLFGAALGVDVDVDVVVSMLW